MAHPCALSIAMIVLGLIGLAYFGAQHLRAARQSAAEYLLSSKDNQA